MGNLCTFNSVTSSSASPFLDSVFHCLRAIHHSMSHYILENCLFYSFCHTSFVSRPPPPGLCPAPPLFCHCLLFGCSLLQLLTDLSSPPPLLAAALFFLVSLLSRTNVFCLVSNCTYSFSFAQPERGFHLFFKLDFFVDYSISVTGWEL